MCAADGSERGAPPWPRTLRSTQNRPTSSGDSPSTAMSNPVRSGVLFAALNGTSGLPPPVTDSPRKQRLRFTREMLVRPAPLATTTTSFLPSAWASPVAAHSATTIVAIAIFMMALSEHPGGLRGERPQVDVGEQALTGGEPDIPALELEDQRRGRPEVEPEVLGVDLVEDRVVRRPVVLVEVERHHVPQLIEAVASERVEPEIAAIRHEARRARRPGAVGVVMLARDHLAL